MDPIAQFKEMQKAQWASFQVFEHRPMGEQIQCLTATFEYLCDTAGAGVRGCVHAENVALAP